MVPCTSVSLIKCLQGVVLFWCPEISWQLVHRKQIREEREAGGGGGGALGRTGIHSLAVSAFFTVRGIHVFLCQNLRHKTNVSFFPFFPFRFSYYSLNSPKTLGRLVSYSHNSIDDRPSVFTVSIFAFHVCIHQSIVVECSSCSNGRTSCKNNNRAFGTRKEQGGRGRWGRG